MDTDTSCDTPSLGEASSHEQVVAGVDGLKQEMPDIPDAQPYLPLLSQVRRRRRRVHTNFSDEDESKLLGLIQSCPIIWDSRQRNYNKVEMKSAKWAEWARMLNTEGEGRNGQPYPFLFTLEDAYITQKIKILAQGNSFVTAAYFVETWAYG